MAENEALLCARCVAVQIAYPLGDDSELGHDNITYYSKPQTLKRERDSGVRRALSDCRRAYASSVGSYSLQLHSYRILAPQLSAHLHSIKHFSEKLHVLQSAVIFKNLDTLRSCFSVQALCFCIVFLDHVKYLQIHATGATSTLADWHTQKIHACSEVGSRPIGSV